MDPFSAEFGQTDQPGQIPTEAAPRRAVIVIDMEHGKPNYEFVGVNGVGYQIQRGVEVEVPASVVGVLNNAIATRPVTDESGRIVSEQNYHAVPFRVIRWVK